MGNLHFMTHLTLQKVWVILLVVTANEQEMEILNEIFDDVVCLKDLNASFFADH